MIARWDRWSAQMARPPFGGKPAHRWSGILAVAAQHAFAATLLQLPLANEDCWDGEAPVCHDVVADARWTFPVWDSRLGPQ